MKTTQLAWIVGGGSVAAMGLLTMTMMGGCSSNPSGSDAGPDATAQDSGHDVSTSDASNDVASNNDTGGDSGCEMSYGPFETDAGPYCPFQGDGGTFGGCGMGNHCCVPAEGTGNSFCDPLATACAFPDASAPKNADFRCNETADCSGGEICCLNAGATLGQDQGCTYYYVSKDTGTTCMQSCGAQPQMCGQDSDCTTSGQTCHQVSTLAQWLGVCQ